MSPLIQGVPRLEINPPDVSEVVAEELFSLTPEVQGQPPEYSLFKGVIPDEGVGISRGYEIYETSLEDAGQDVLGGAQFQGWYYTLFAGTEAIGYLEMALQADNSYQPRRIGGEQWMPDLLAECQFAETLDAVQQEDYILSFLRVWSLGIFVLWLRPVNPGSTDIIVPLPPASPLLRPEPKTELGREQFIKIVRSIANRRLESGLNVIEARTTRGKGGGAVAEKME